MVAHVKHMFQKGGEDFVAIGTDFDGFHGAARMEIENIGEIDVLKEALLKNGFTERQVEKIWYRNAKRVIDEVM